MEIPTIESERLIMRSFRDDDFEPMARFFASDVSSFYGGPCDRIQAWRKFAVYPGHWALRGYGPFALEVRESGDFIGICGPWYPEGWPEPEITWALVPGHHGHGYATEAARRALRFSYESLRWPTAVSVVADGNDASVRVAQRLGATLESSFEGAAGETRHLFRHAALSELA